MKTQTDSSRSRPSGARHFLAAILCFSVYGCTSTNKDESSLGTETNWLQACQDDSQCGALSCVCGICSRACATAEDCGTGSVACADANALDKDSCSRGTSGVCVPQCQASCTGGFVCQGGACIPGSDADASSSNTASSSADASSADGSASPSTTPTTSALPSSSATTATTGTADAASGDAGGADSSAPADAGETDAGLVCQADMEIPNGCCLSDEDCEGAQLCYDADCSETARLGRCAVPVEGSCYSKRDCDVGEVCQGGMLAACGTSGPDSLGSCVVDSCDTDMCHPERCDEVGEACCDPLPGDGPNYCNNQLVCSSGTCELAVGDFECGPVTCNNVTTFCAETYPGTPDSEVTYGCSNLPAECAPGPSTCDCMNQALGNSVLCREEIPGAVIISYFAP